MKQFYSQNSRAFESDFDKLGGALKSFAKVGAVNGEHNGDLVQKYRVSSYPTFYLFAPGLDEPLLYEGSRKVGAMSSWIINKYVIYFFVFVLFVSNDYKLYMSIS